ncbi:hypothetical protein TELCIR_07279 [Teladorsagia circumcincta]|uniref:Uncharacterized protein n=1 Tax=Teladorsagia circumcincta TaxID=45464 RepID=A0A2G9UL27_TELCI|nr:hypothetical protein TELCIR_07279 [Teladorsagia circumcincta]
MNSPTAMLHPQASLALARGWNIEWYQRRLEETSKRITDDMSADIALARKERELEHERLIEAYREKMLLYDDLTRLRKEKSQKRKKSPSWFD